MWKKYGEKNTENT